MATLGIEVCCTQWLILNVDYSRIDFYLFGLIGHGAGVDHLSLAVVARHVALQAPSSRLSKFGHVPH